MDGSTRYLEIILFNFSYKHCANFLGRLKKETPQITVKFIEKN